MATTRMTRPRDAIVSPAAPAHSALIAAGDFLLCFGWKRSARGIVFWNAVPLYQQILQLSWHRMWHGMSI